ncbi:hypothetical protein WN51_08162 [Melipona quadrifasciata]|uniref:Uncharacterized protein n=1 Tax=Melipona quadrifasciata TaxID=166423 RepID=A0A0M8ZNM0_9HYME|nr:hypothetical protein WN51_08162 [Melipona quadrifasciata]
MTEGLRERKRSNYLHRNGLSQEGMERLRNEIGEEETCKTLVMRDREIQLQVQYDKISRSKYDARYKFISCYGRPEYLTKKGNRDSQKFIARARVGNVEEYSKYWLKEEERRCRLCERQSGTLKHLIKEREKDVSIA